MKTVLNLPVLAMLVAWTSMECLAMRSIGIVTADEAKGLGLEVRATAAGPDAAWLELEFVVVGKLKDYRPEFSHVELEVREGQKPLIGYVALKEQHPKPGHVRVRFLANRACIEKLVLTIVVGEGAMVGGAYELHVKDFVNPAMIR